MVAGWTAAAHGAPALNAERSASAVLRGPRPVRDLSAYAGAVHLSLVAIVVKEYAPAIGFFVARWVFELVEDSLSWPGPRFEFPG